MLCFSISFVAAGSESQLVKTGVAEDRLPKMSPKFAPRCGPRAIRKPKSLKTGMAGRLFGINIRKNCTTLWRESGLEVKIVS